MSKNPSIMGGACIIASVCVGAGMLGLPTSGVGAWTMWSIATITLTMIMMTLSGWLLLEVYSRFHLRASFSTVTKSLLGNKINLINNTAVYFVGGILLYAYTTASGEILEGIAQSAFNFNAMSPRIWSVVFVLIFSFFVWHSTRLVDRISVLLIFFMSISFILSISGLALHIDLTYLFDWQPSQAHYAPYAIAMLPVALTSFGYHHSVATMRAYYGNEHQAKQAILGGTAIALTLYLLWIISVFGNLPRHSFIPIIEADGNLDVLLSVLSKTVASDQIKTAINAFSIAAILSSFIGVGLGVFDYLADFFKFENTRLGRTQSWAVTFLPPLIFSFAFPLGFLKAIGYAGAVATIWTCIIPALLAYKVRKSGLKTTFQVKGGLVLIIILLVFGILTACIHFLTLLGWLPVFLG